MRLFRFDSEIAKPVNQFDSSFRHVFLAITDNTLAGISCMYFAAGDRVGLHDAVSSQLFAVVDGKGWVQDGTRTVSIVAGNAAFWTSGESHAAGTDAVMTAIVIESANLEPWRWMPELDLAGP